jgi:hypothetical protein
MHWKMAGAGRTPVFDQVRNFLRQSAPRLVPISSISVVDVKRRSGCFEGTPHVTAISVGVERGKCARFRLRDCV